MKRIVRQENNRSLKLLEEIEENTNNDRLFEEANILVEEAYELQKEAIEKIGIANKKIEIIIARYQKKAKKLKSQKDEIERKKQEIMDYQMELEEKLSCQTQIPLTKAQKERYQRDTKELVVQLCEYDQRIETIKKKLADICHLIGHDVHTETVYEMGICKICGEYIPPWKRFSSDVKYQRMVIEE